MRQRFGFVAEQQDNVASSRLLAQQTQPQPGPIDRLRVLPPVQAMARARSASSRRADRASAFNSTALSAVTITRGRPTMTRPIFRQAHQRIYQTWRGPGKAA